MVDKISADDATEIRVVDDNDERLCVSARDFKHGTRRDGVQTQPLGCLRPPSRAAAVCLGLLCVLLIARIISLWSYQAHHDFQTRFKNLSEERDLLQASYINLTEERDLLQASYNDLNIKSGRLKTMNTRLNMENELIRDLFTARGRVQFAHTTYYISIGLGTWNESRQDCLGRGADLIIIDSREEQVFLTGLHRKLWIGLSDPASDRHFKWVNGSDLTIGYWAPGEPNNYEGITEDCVETTANKGEMLNNWNDVPCNSLNAWICEFYNSN